MFEIKSNHVKVKKHLAKLEKLETKVIIATYTHNLLLTSAFNYAKGRKNSRNSVK